MAKQGHQFGNVSIYGSAPVVVGDNYVINQYHTGWQARPSAYETLLASLSYDGIGTRMRNIDAALPETCKWLRCHPQFIAWTNGIEMEKHHGLLWLKGKPGSGKSTIMKETLVWAHRTWSNQTVLSYFFNARSPHALHKSSLGLYRSLVWQLQNTLSISRALFIEQFVSKIWEKSVDGRTEKCVEEWTETELQNFITTMIQTLSLPPITIFIDALDEGADDNIRRMVKFLERLTQHATTTGYALRILLSSRHYPHISVAKSFSIVVEDQEGHGRDIESYVKSELLGHGILEMENLRQQVQARSAGVFLWVVLVVSILNEAYDQGRSVAIMLRKLSEMPPDLRDLFTRIFLENGKDTNECITLLQWVLFANRPLDPVELYHAVHVTHSSIDGDKPLLVTFNEAVRYLRSCSRGLIELTKDENVTVQFIHETVRGYLIGSHEKLIYQEIQQPTQDIIVTQNFQANICHEKLAYTCLYYLRQSYRRPASPEEVQRFDPLSSYAAGHWWRHLQSISSPCSPSVVQLALELLTTSGKSLLFWVQLYDIHRYGPNPGQTVHSISPPLYYAAFIGRHELVSAVLAVGANVNARGGYFGTALAVASAGGHEKVVQMLLGAGADVNMEAGNYGTALVAASGGGHEKVVQILLDAGTDVNARGRYDNTALAAASAGGHEKVVQILLDAGAGANGQRGFNDNIALVEASERGHEKVVRILLHAGADVNARGRYSVTALAGASLGGHEKVVQILVEAGADVNARGGGMSGVTALVGASAGGHEKVVQILVEAGADVNARGGGMSGDTALVAASQGGHEKIVRMLVYAGARHR